MTQAAAQLTCTHIIVINEVFHTRVEGDSPQSPQECLENHGAVAPAFWFIERCRLIGDHRHLGCSIRHDEHTLIVDWHVVGDPARARRAMQAVLRRGWKEWV